jgi:CHAT domain-containing protein
MPFFFQTATTDILHSMSDISLTLSLQQDALWQILSLEPAHQLQWRGIRTLMKELSRPLVILSISSSPQNLMPLNIAKEIGELEGALKEVELSYSFQLHQVSNCRIKDLTRSLDRYKPDILLFSGHGGGDTIELQDDRKQSVSVNKFHLTRLLERQKRLKLVILNCCYSLTGSQYLANAIGQVIVMQGSVDDEEAIDFSREFFTALGDGRTFADSFDRTTRALRLNISSRLQPWFLKGWN